MSMARALNRKLARISLGGVHDEADIRGHRKTYVGAMPGRIINAVQPGGQRETRCSCWTRSTRWAATTRGDPASALLEVLDAEQNATFRDHFVELPFDLSDVLFITTANTTSTIPRPLLDRMEVIELPSYTDEEKLQIAKSYLLPKQLKRHGLKKSQVRMTDARHPGDHRVLHPRVRRPCAGAGDRQPCAEKLPWASSPRSTSRPM